MPPPLSPAATTTENNPLTTTTTTKATTLYHPHHIAKRLAKKIPQTKKAFEAMVERVLASAPIARAATKWLDNFPQRLQDIMDVKDYVL